MAEVLFVLEGDDPGAALVAAAFRRHGWRCRVLDLRYTRPALLGGTAEPAVSVDGDATVPDVVLNRTATSGLGLPGPAALDRQLPQTWSGRHLAAREEQGLLLAAFDCWDRLTRLLNPVRTADLRLVDPTVPAPPEPGADGRRGVCWVVESTVVAACAEGSDGTWREVTISDATVDLACRRAAAGGMRLGQIDFWQQRGGPTTVVDWTPQPRFQVLRDRTGVDVAALAVAAIVGEPVAVAPPFVATDLVANVGPPDQAQINQARINQARVNQAPPVQARPESLDA